MDGGTLASVVVAILAILVAIFAYRMSRRPKRLGYSFDRWLKLLDADHPDLVVSHRGVVVNDPYYFEIRVRNCGKVEVRPEDFVSPLQLVLSDTIVDASVVTEGDDQVPVAMQKGSRSLTFAPALLNPGEEIAVSGIASKVSHRSTFRLEYHIAGVRTIRKMDDGRALRAVDLAAIVSSGVLGAVLVAALVGELTGLFDLFSISYLYLWIPPAAALYVSSVMRWWIARRAR